VQFEELYNQHKNLVYNLALQYVQNTEDAEEITQDVFVSVYEKLDSFRQESKHSTWLYRITINKSLDFIKAKKRQKRFSFFTTLFHEETGEVKHQVSDFNHPGVLMEEKEQLRKLFSLINELPDNQKTALILMKIEEKSQAETGEIMNLSPKAVESLVQRAKSNLAKKLNHSEGK
jgi:RNA polymerase sigma-70 factor (ECF subfamily)